MLIWNVSIWNRNWVEGNRIDLKYGTELNWNRLSSIWIDADIEVEFSWIEMIMNSKFKWKKMIVGSAIDIEF